MERKNEIIEDALLLAKAIRKEKELPKGVKYEAFMRKMELTIKDLGNSHRDEVFEILATVKEKLKKEYGDEFTNWFIQFMQFDGINQEYSSKEYEVVASIYHFSLNKGMEYGLTPLNLLGCLDLVKAIVRKEHIALTMKDKEGKQQIKRY